MSWFPLKIRSHDSLQIGLSKGRQIVDRLDELGYTAGALVDIANVAGCPNFMNESNDTRKDKNTKEDKRKKSKAILGSCFNICKEDSELRVERNEKTTHTYVLARNLLGWQRLIKASSASYRPENSYHRPRLNLERLAGFSEKSFVVYSGSIGTELADEMFTESRIAYKLKSEDDVKKMLHKDWSVRLLAAIEKYKELFGPENFFIEIELMDNFPAANLIGEAMRWAGKKSKTPCIAVSNSFYCKKNDASDQRVLLCSARESTMDEIQQKLNTIEIEISRFFTSNKYYIPSIDEVKELYTESEMENTVKIVGQCETYALGSKPRFPKFDCDGMSEDDYLKKLCAEGWKKKIAPILKTPEDKRTYSERIKKELDVFIEADLSSYFLIVEDIIRWANENGIRTGVGRGSAGGCLTSYLLSIIQADPVKHDLIFERFYSPGRNTPDVVSFPELEFDKFQ